MAKTESQRRVAPLAKKLLAADIAHPAKTVVYYLVAVLFVLSSNTLYGRAANLIAPINWSLLTLCIIVTAFLWAGHSISKRFITRWSAWAVTICVSYLLVATVGSALGTVRIRFFAAYLALFPLLVHLLRQQDELGRLLRVFENVVALIAASSLILWIIGPILEFVSPNCLIDTNWSDLGTTRQVVGYNGLLFLTQRISIGDMQLWRNTSMFVEAPMYAYTLVVALLLELFMQKRSRRLVCIVICITIVSTVSTLGIVLAALAITLKNIDSLRSKYKSNHILIVVVMLGVLAIALIACVLLITNKMGSSSGAIRIDDFKAGYLSWSHAPVFGWGFGKNVALRTYMSDFRMYNIGFSNSLFWELVQGGIIYCVPHLIAFGGFFSIKADATTKAMGACFFAAWLFAIVAILPITAFLMAIGVERFCGSQTTGKQDYLRTQNRHP